MKRPGDTFTAPVVSRRAVILPKSTTPLNRYFGQWSDRYHRITLNLSSPAVTVKILSARDNPKMGVQCIVHWIPRQSLLSTGEGSVCQSDGWPVDLWQRLSNLVRRRTKRSVAEGLREVAMDRAIAGDDDIVVSWRRAVTSEHVDPSIGHPWGDAWLPVAAEITGGRRRERCLLSWSPTAVFNPSLTEAIAAAASADRQVDRQSQARYYFECVLSGLHGVRFGSDDFVVDEEYERLPEVRRLMRVYRGREQGYLATAEFGRLAKRGHW